MRKLGLTLSFLATFGLLVWGWAVPSFAQVGPPNVLQCNKVGTMAVGPTTITQIVAAPTAPLSVSICGWHVTNTGAAGTFSFQYGTGANCGTGTQTLIPAVNVTSSAPSADHIDYAQITIPAGNALCVTPSVATISALVYYVIS